MPAAARFSIPIIAEDGAKNEGLLRRLVYRPKTWLLSQPPDTLSKYKAVMPKVSPFVYWSLEVPYLVLGALIVLVLVHALVSAVTGRSSSIARALGVATRPVTATVGAITPRIVPPAGLVACAIAWLIALRIVLTMVAQGFGLRLWG
jgi:hypothetical protein